MPVIGKPLEMSENTSGVASRGSGVWRSRSISRPVTWSICASISSTAAMPLSRMARAGCSSGASRIWVRMSGEALTSSQSLPSALMAMDDCVRACALSVPRRKPSQLGQLQFHCGKPPPADDPRTLMRMSVHRGKEQKGRTCGSPVRPDHIRLRCSAVGDVHRDFEAETQVGESGGGPLHGLSPVEWVGMKHVCELVSTTAPQAATMFSNIDATNHQARDNPEPVPGASPRSAWPRPAALPLGRGHRMAFRTVGGPRGEPWLLLHGGPGPIPAPG